MLRRTGQVAGGVSLAAAGLGAAPSHADETEDGVVLNDVQSRLNATRVREVVRPTSVDDLAAAVQQARRSGRAISVAGGRHAMGGQQFGAGNLHIDSTSLDRLGKLDRERGLITVDAGIQWPVLIQGLHALQEGDQQPWTIREKQTGVDAVTIGGSLSSNIHGRSLAHPPLVGDIESFDLVDAAGKVRHCSRSENSELFSLAIGGYGLFGLIARVTLRLTRRFKIRRKVEIIAVKDLLEGYARRREQGFAFGDCQYATDMSGPGEEHPGVFSCYEPVGLDTPIPQSQRTLTGENWARLYRLLRTDKKRAYTEYADYYRSTDGQVYWSDTHQLAGAFTDYVKGADAATGTDMITEVYQRHENIMPFFSKVREDLLRRNADVTYGTIRFIEADRETFLPWAKEKSVCVVCNLHVRHTPEGIAKAEGDFRQIIDRALEFGGAFFLTYHRWATPQQVAAAYPRIREFFRLKRKYDPGSLFQSEWYRHYAPHFA
jgi:FAD/FMN-containing dehydrogenase